MTTDSSDSHADAKASKLSGLLRRVPAPALFVASGVFQYSGAAIAISLFVVMSPAVVTWWRLAVGAVVLLLMVKPWRMSWTWRHFWAAVLFGVSIGIMNLLFYTAIDRLPLGVAVSIEFLGPVFVAVIRGRGWATRIAALLALGGVVSIGGLGLDLADAGTIVGVICIFGAAAMWAMYIIVGQSIASQRSGVASLAVGCAVVAVVFAPFVMSEVIAVSYTPTLFLAIIGVGVLSTVIPYSFESVALGRLGAPMFALLTALLPATSAVIGALVLQQIPSGGALVGMILVSLAVWIASRAE